LGAVVLLAVGVQGAAASSTITYHADFTANDVSGSHDGTWVGTARYATGFTGAAGDGAFAFTGDGARVVMDKSVGRFGTAPATISFELQTTNTASQQSVMGERSICNNPSQGWWDIRQNPSGQPGALDVEFGGSRSYIDAYGSRNIADGAWHAVVVRRDNTGVTITIDGVIDGFAPGPSAKIWPSVPFGVDNSPCISVDGTLPMQGNIDDITITQ
jgi:hypothetical protein